MLALYIIYAVLIVAAIVVVPLRIRARRQTLKDIDALRSTLQKNMEELLSKIAPANIEKAIEHEQFEEDRILHTLLTQRPYEQFVFVKSEKAFYHYALSLEAPIKERYTKLAELRERSWEQAEEDIWSLARNRSKLASPTRRHYSNLLVTV